MLNKLIEFANEENGVAAYVVQSAETGKFHAVLRDVGAEETVGVVICGDFAQAKAKAEGFVR